MERCLLIIILISVFKLHCYEASKLFTITDDALSIGREILTEVEKTVPGKTNVSAVAETMYGLLRKFHDKHNNPVRHNYINSGIFVELSSRTLQDLLLKFQDIEFATGNLKYKIDAFKTAKEEAFTPSSFYLSENVFDLLNLKTNEKRVHNLHNLLFKKDPDTGDSILNILINEPWNWVCWSSSRQQILYTILNYIVTTDAFNYILTQCDYAAYKVQNDALDKLQSYRFRILKKITSTWTEKDVIKKMKNLEKDFIERNTKTLNKLIDAMTGQSREAWSCDNNENEHKNEETLFTKLENLFQMYIINEVDLNEDDTCKKECGNYYQTRQYGCYDGGLCKRQRSCNGTLWDCGTQIDATMNICLQDKEQKGRYKFVQTDSKTYGHNSNCREFVLAKSWPRGFYKCTYCTCTCEDMNANGDRYINLRPVQSDIHSNYVITNAKFTKVNNIIHIQIEETELLTNGFVNETSMRWKEIENYKIHDENVKKYDYHTITWNKRKVYLGDTDAPRHHVLTGLRFSSVSDGITLEIGTTSFNFNTGKLSSTIQWSGSAMFDYEWNEWKFENKDEINTKNEGKYTKFTTNDVNVDVGQTTIPYVHTDEVIYSLRVPLSGAGLFTKSKKGVGSFLALKFLTYDFVGDNM